MDYSNFIGSINIAGLTGGCESSGYPAGGTDEMLDRIIEEREAEILYCILGDMYSEYYIGINDVAPLSKWTDLRDGADFSIDGLILKFVGLDKIAAHYVYFYFQQNQATITSSLGEVKADHENAINQSPFGKQLHAWNRMLEYIGACDKCCSKCVSVQIETCIKCKYKPTLLNYLTNSSHDYENWEVGSPSNNGMNIWEI